MQRKVAKYARHCPEVKIDVLEELSLNSKPVEDPLIVDLQPKVLYCDTENVIDVKVVQGNFKDIHRIKISMIALS